MSRNTRLSDWISRASAEDFASWSDERRRVLECDSMASRALMTRSATRSVSDGTGSACSELRLRGETFGMEFLLLESTHRGEVEHREPNPKRSLWRIQCRGANHHKRARAEVLDCIVLPAP